MIDQHEFVRGDRFPNLCDMRVGTESALSYKEQLQIPDQKFVSIYAKTENAQKAIDIIAQNPQTQFTLVTHNSDLSVCGNPRVPSNLRRWFAQNKDTDHKWIFPLPIGLENQHWFPYKEMVMKNTYSEFCDLKQKDRATKVFAQFNPDTHPERTLALNQIDKDLCDIYSGANGNASSHGLFCENLMRYAFCLCPRGNGIDTHRMWEALYMGCIPICKRHHAHEFNNRLPILFVNEWTDITSELLFYGHKSVDLSLFNSDLLKMSYWKKKISYEI